VGRPWIIGIDAAGPGPVLFLPPSRQLALLLLRRWRSYAPEGCLTERAVGNRGAIVVLCPSGPVVLACYAAFAIGKGIFAWDKAILGIVQLALFVEVEMFHESCFGRRRHRIPGDQSNRYIDQLAPSFG
jgi:hypothetical protein